MGFHEDARFPTKLAAGSRFGQRHHTSVVSNQSAYSQRTPKLDMPLIVADVSSALTSTDGANELLRFFTARQGATYGFRFPHPFDRSSAANDRSDDIANTNQRLGIGDGATRRFQIRKSVSSGGITRLKTITKPVAGTVIAAIDRIATTAFDADPTTGEVLFFSPPQLDSVITCGYLYDIPMRFDESVEESMMIGYQPADNALMPTVELVEERFVDVTHGEFFFGGSHVVESMDTIVQMSVLRGRVVDLRPTRTGLSARLPDFTELPTGGPHFYVNNRSDTTPFNIHDFDGVDLASIAPAETKQVLLVDGPTGKRWVIL